MRRKLSRIIAAAFLCISGSMFTDDLARNCSWAAEPAIAAWDPVSIDARIEAWQPTTREKAFDEIGWARDLREAKKLAMENGRAIFLFTYDGSDLACFRC